MSSKVLSSLPLPLEMDLSQPWTLLGIGACLRACVRACTRVHG